MSKFNYEEAKAKKAKLAARLAPIIERGQTHRGSTLKATLQGCLVRGNTYCCPRVTRV